MIYFIQDSGTLEVKIGYTEGPSAEPRLTALQTGNPGRLVLLCTLEGDRSDEAGLHRRFASARGIGEWFRPTSAILTYLLAVIRGDGHAAGYRQGYHAGFEYGGDIFCELDREPTDEEMAK